MLKIIVLYSLAPEGFPSVNNMYLFHVPFNVFPVPDTLVVDPNKQPRLQEPPSPMFVDGGTKTKQGVGSCIGQEQTRQCVRYALLFLVSTAGRGCLISSVLRAKGKTVIVRKGNQCAVPLLPCL